MRHSRSLLVFAGAALLLADEPIAAAEAQRPTGAEILAQVRFSQATQHLRHLKGRLRISKSDLDKNYDGSVYPFDLTMSDRVIRFGFADPPKETILLNLREDHATLTRETKAGKVEMPASLYGERVRQTAINYEDLSMRFLYWPNARVVDEQTVSLRQCWLVRVPNPDQRGPYRQVDVWVDQGNGAMVRTRAYDGQGRLLKEFNVRDVQKYKDAYILKTMRVETRDPASGKVIGRTYLEIDDPD
jgi:hypothetical protein